MPEFSKTLCESLPKVPEIVWAKIYGCSGTSSDEIDEVNGD